MTDAIAIANAALHAAHFALCYRFQDFIADDPPMIGKEAQWRVWHLHPRARDEMTAADARLYDALMRTRGPKEPKS